MKQNRYFWIIVAMAFIATALSFLDRHVLSNLIIEIKQELSVSDVEYGFINTGFLVGYAIMFTVSGILITSIIGFAWAIVWLIVTIREKERLIKGEIPKCDNETLYKTDKTEERNF